MKHALISIKPRFVESIISGVKTIEIRRRRANLATGQWLWIYSTQPKACVEAVAEVRQVTTAAPEEIWRDFGRQAAISEQEYLAYTREAPEITAIELGHATRLSQEISLKELRAVAGRFHPPQFFSWLESGSPILEFFLQLAKARHQSIEPSLALGSL